MQITELPALRFLLIASLGFLIGIFFPTSQKTLLAILFIAVLLFVVFILFKKKELAYYFAVILCGVYFSGMVANNSADAPKRIIPEFPAQFNGKITKIISERESSIKCIAEGMLESKIFPNKHKCRLILNIYSFEKDNKFISISNSIVAKVKARIPQQAIFPKDFDEWRYAKSIDVQWIARANAKDVAIRTREEDFFSFTEKLLQSVKMRLRRLFPENTVGIATALITGDKTQIPSDVKKNFSYTGTAHILAISGFHIGLIASIIFILLGFLKNNLLKQFVFFPLLLAFVIFTGFQPSSIRAAVFIFFLTLNKGFERRIYSLNILCLTVTVILLFSPQMLYSVGFQMSLIAVFGIVILYKAILNFFHNFIKSKNAAIDFAIKSVSVSLAASITVSPIVAYYFGIYSIVQPISNFFVVPLISLGMVFTMLALAFSFASFGVASFYSKSADFLFSLSQKLNKFATMENLSYIEGSTVFAISIAISFILAYIIFSKTKRQVIFRLSVSSIAFLCLLSFLGTEKQKNAVLYPNEAFVLAHIPLAKNKDCILIVDRKPKLAPFKSYNVLNFINSMPGDLLLGYSGNIGINYSDHFKGKKNLKSFPLSLEMQKRIAKEIFNKNYLHKETKLNYEP